MEEENPDRPLPAAGNDNSDGREPTIQKSIEHDISVQEFDRKRTCPFLLRCFWKLNQHNAPIDYRHASKGILPNQEVQIYTWLNASLLEINEILKDVIVPMQGANVSVVFNIVYVDNSNGHFAMRRV